MSVTVDAKEAVVESSPEGDLPDITQQALDQRIRQQEILSELGVIALQGDTIEASRDDSAPRC